jgi:hypothetical protein
MHIAESYAIEKDIRGRNAEKPPCSAMTKLTAAREITPTSGCIRKWKIQKDRRLLKWKPPAATASPRRSMLDALASAVERVSRKPAAHFVVLFGLPTGCCA